MTLSLDLDEADAPPPLRAGERCWLWLLGPARWGGGWRIDAAHGDGFVTVSHRNHYPITVPTWRVRTARPKPDTPAPIAPPGAAWAIQPTRQARQI